MKRIYTTLRLLFLITLTSIISPETWACPITGDSAVCESETVTYLSTTTGAGYDYEWNAFGGSILGTGSSATVSWGTAGSGQVTLIVRNNLGTIVCTDVHNITIHPNPEPFITPSFAAGCLNDSIRNTTKRDGLECLPVCDSTWVTYSTPNNAGSTYTWIVEGSATFTPSTTNEQTVYWTGVGVGGIKVTETTLHGCVGDAEICVEIVPKPNASITALPGPVAGIVNVCLNQNVLFINNSNAGLGSDLWSYTWFFGDGQTEVIDAGDEDGSTSHIYTSPGTYTVTFIAENECHCTDTAYLTVEVSSLPGPNISCISTVCPGTQVTYYTDSSCPSHLWTATNGTIIGGDNNPTVTVEWGTSGPGYLSLTTSGCPGLCSSPTFVEVPIIPVTATIEGPTLVCAFDCVQYKISCDIPIDSIVWHAPAGVTVTSDTIDKHMLNVCFYDFDFDSGVISVEYYKTVPGANPALSCGGSAELTIYQRPKLTLVFPAEICDNTLLNGNHFTKPATGNITWTITGAGGSPTYSTVTLAANVSYQPTWIWGPGLFTITAEDLDNNFCNAPQSTNIKVNPIPNPPDSIIGDLLVCPNSAHEYLGVYSPTSNTLAWNITGGTPLTTVGPSASILWGPAPTYSITVRQQDPVTGCKSDPITQVVNSILPLSPSLISGAITACANTTESYSVTDPGDNFTWSIAPSTAGSVISGQGSDNIVVEWNNYAGIATLVLVREVCGNTITSTLNVDLSTSPAPNMTVPSPICEDATVTMSTTTTGATFEWSFGDGTSATGSTVTHGYVAPGNYTVTLTATYTACGDTVSNFANIMVHPRPNITISTPDPNIFCGTVNTVNMYVASPASGTDYDWYRAPSTFLTTGSAYSSSTIGGYFVIGTNSYGCKDTSNVIPIDTACNPGCRPSNLYSADYDKFDIGCNQDSFVANLTGLAFGPTWDFDDPFNATTASGNNVTHTFTEPGYYRVEMCFKVPNDQVPPTDTCNVCIMKVDTIKYKPGFADSLYCEDGLDSVRLLMLNETKILTGFPAPSYQWQINGSNVSTAANPILTLPPGTHTITLIVDGVCELTKTYIIPTPPSASFIMPDSICEDVAIAITNTSTGTGVNANWDFGDGSSSLIYSPNKAWDNANDYTVVLTLTNSFGCTNSFRDTITVLPNTLSASITALPSSICDGDSSILTSTVTGGYPAYEYLWNNLDLDVNSAAYYTGDYYLNILDQYGCRTKSNIVNVQVNPKPSPIINGDIDICLGDFVNYVINYPSSAPGEYQVEWSLNGASTPWLTTNNFGYSGNAVGTDTLYVTVESPEGCIGYDTVIITTFGLPDVSIATSGAMCEGPLHLLDGNSTSTNILDDYWSTGHTDDSLFISLPGWYRYTIVDSNACQATASVTIHPLPEFCGLLTGCYEICDTVSELTWSGPTGYANYQWLFNGNPIAGANGDSLNIPLYVSGIYNLVITTGFGCTDTSEDIDIQFVSCGCNLDTRVHIDCGPIGPAGEQTYTLMFTVDNTLGAGANINITSPNGTLSGISPTSLVPGLNTITATFIDIFPSDDTVCFTITLDLMNVICDTTICQELPSCEGDCESDITMKSTDCLGYDGAGNPIYEFCMNIVWGGSNGSTLTVGSPGNNITPGSVTVNNGSNFICFTYTDLPTHGEPFLGYFNFFDSANMMSCRDTFKTQFEPCPEDSCKLPILGICAHCRDKIQGQQTYSLEITINNTTGATASVNVMDIVGGVFGTISPATVPPGISTIAIQFTDTGARDSIICFRVVLNGGGHVCWADICVYLPDCDKVGINDLEAKLTYFVLYPNPSSDLVNINFNMQGVHENSIEVLDLSGKTILTQALEGAQESQLNVSSLAKGMYIVRFISDGKVKGNIKFTKL